MTSKPTLACAAVLVSFAAVAFAKPTTYASVQAKDLTGETHLLKNGLDARALNAFRLKFDTSDHEINALGFLPTYDRIFLAMSDQNGDDKYSFDGLYMSNPAISTPRKATGECDGSGTVCSLAIEVGQSERGNVFVLQGFKFKRKGNNDANVKRIQVRGNLAQKRVEVLFVDGGKTPYTAEVQFFTSSPKWYRQIGSVNGSRTSGAPGLVLKTNMPGTETLISGFDLEFANGDHHLAEVSIIPGASGIEVQFRDHNGDDPFRATVDYAVYKVDP